MVMGYRLWVVGYGLWAIRMAISNSTPYTLHPTPYTLNPLIAYSFLRIILYPVHATRMLIRGLMRLKKQ